MKSISLSSSVVALMFATPSFAAEQGETEKAEGRIVIGTVNVEAGGEAPVSHRFGDPLDSGTSGFNQESIEARTPGSGDVNQVLRILPTVQFSSKDSRASGVDLQDLRPANISISGGRFTENLFVVDGIGVNSRLDVSSTNPNHYIEGNAAGSAQSLWIDSSLVGEIIVRDSNVSAEYGQFTGGVVQINTRAPSQEFGVTAHYGQSGNEFAQFVISDKTRAALGDAEPSKPDYRKYRFGASMDLPVSDDLRFLIGYNQSYSRVKYARGTNYVQHGDYGQEGTSHNLIGKFDADLQSDLRLSGQFTYSPYESEFAHPNGFKNMVYLQGGGLSGSLKLEGEAAHDAQWKIEVSHAKSVTDRRSDGVEGYSISSTADGVDWCSGTSCSIGAASPIAQRQWDSVVKAQWDQPMLGGDMRFGAEYARIKAIKRRDEMGYSLRHISSSGSNSTLPLEVNPNTVCAQPQQFSLSCVDGVYALAQMNVDMPFRSNVNLDGVALWGEWTGQIASVDVRLGARYDYESFLSNHNFAPRLSISRDLPFAGMNVTFGANRYYGRGFLSYALRENYPDNYIFQRSPEVVDGKNIWSDNWRMTSHSILPRYSNADLRTPYSDELTLALRGPAPWIGGEYRIRGIYRDSKDQFALSATEQSQEENEFGNMVTVRTSTATNDGRTKYRGLSAEYVREFGNHSLSLSANYSKTKTTNIDYFELADITEFEGEQVFFNGELVSHLQATANNQREDYAAPLILNADWSALWFNKRLRTNINARYRSGFERVADTGVNTRINGINYDVYELMKYKAAVSFDLSAALDVAKTKLGALTLDVRVNNLFNTVLERDYSSTSNPWQMGRNMWISAKYTY